MKSFFRLLVFGILFITFIPQAQAAEDAASITLEMDGRMLYPDVPPVIREGRTLVPFRSVSEALNLQVIWDDAAQTVTVEGPDMVLKMTVGAREAIKNGAAVLIDVPPLIVSGRTMVPVRFISEALGCQVNWDAQTRLVSIYSQPLQLSVLGFYALGDAQTSSWTDLFGTAYPQKATGNTDIVTELAFGWYTMDEQGQLLTRSQSGWQRPDGWEDILQTTSSQMATQMCVQMTDQNGRIRKMMNDATARQAAIDAMVSEADSFKAVNLDFEGLGWHDTPEELSKVRSDFNLFTSDLASALHARGKQLILSLHPLNSDYPGYDYQSLGQQADQIIIMAYDYGSMPEPETKVEEAVKMASACVSPNKLMLGISANNETDASINGKIAIANRCRLRGIALWRLGLVSHDEWCVLRNMLAEN